MAVDYNDKRFTAVTDEENVELDKLEQRYEGMINENESAVQDLIENSKEAAETLKEEQNKQLDNQIATIEQQKELAQKDYVKEQSGAYVDWQKESNKYGAKEEQVAAAGLTGSGYHESTQVSIYNAYQNRVAVARDAIERTKMNYNNAINEAKLQNSSILAEIALKAHQEQLQLALEGLQYKNTLLQEKANERMQIKSIYYSKWQDVLNQINTENALAEEQRQFNAQLQEEQRQFDILHGGASYSDGYSYKLGDNIVTAYSDGKSGEYTGNRREENKTKTIKTDYYSGPIAKNVGGFGYMGKDKNGVAYQPKGVEINGKAYKLSKTGKTAGELVGKGFKNSSGVNIENQNVWTANGKYFVWNGTKNKYEQIVISSSGNKGSYTSVSYPGVVHMKN